MTDHDPSWQPPPPPPPPSSAAADSVSPADSSKRRLLIGGGILAAIAVVVAVFLLLGGGDDGDDDRIAANGSVEDPGEDVGDNPLGGDGTIPDDLEEQLTDAYETSLGLPKEKAECLAGKITDAIESGDLTEEQAMQDMFGYLSDCDIDISELTGGG